MLGKISLILIVIAVVLLGGIYVGMEIAEPETITETQIKEVPVQNIEARHPNSLEELKELLNDYEPIKEVKGLYSENSICINSAYDLMVWSFNRGYLLPTRKKWPEDHLWNMALIGDYTYFIEPQSKKIFTYFEGKYIEVKQI